MRVNLATLDASALDDALTALERDATARQPAWLCLHVRLATVHLRNLCLQRASATRLAAALHVHANRVAVIATTVHLAATAASGKRSLDESVGSVHDRSSVLRLLLAPLLGGAVACDRVLRSELLQFVSVYAFAAFIVAPDAAGPVAALVRDAAAVSRRATELRGEARCTALLVAAHIELAAGAYGACVELCDAALELAAAAADEALRGNALYVRGFARLALRLHVGALDDFDGALRAAHRPAASATMREVCRVALGGADWRVVSQALGRAAAQHSGGATSTRHDLDAATALLNLARVFRAADRAESTATILGLLAEACGRERERARVDTSELVAVCCAAPARARDAAQPRTLCDVDAAGVRYLAAKAALQAGQLEAANEQYARVAEALEHADVAPAQLYGEWVYVQLCLGDGTRALALCDEAARVVGTLHVSVALLRADALVLLGNSAAALEQLEQIEEHLAREGTSSAEEERLRAAARNNRALLHLRLGQVPSALKLLRLLVSAEPHNVAAAYNFCIVARSLGAAYECEACIAWLEARRVPVLDDALKFADLAAKRRAQLEQLDPRERSGAHDGLVSGAVSQRAALALDVVVLKRWCTLIADPRLYRQLAEARGRR